MDYAKMMKEALAEKRGSIEGIQKQLQDRLAREEQATIMDRVDLRPAAALIDSMQGSNLAQVVGTKPTEYQQNEQVIAKLRDALGEQKDEYANQALAFFKNKAYMDQVAAQTENAQANRNFDHWLAKEKLAQGDRALDIKAQKSQSDKNKAPSINRDQGNAAGFGKRMLQAESVFADLENSGYNRGTRGESMKDYFVPTEFTDENLRRWSQAERNFINATLRRESGAAIAPHEFESAEKQYFPRPGDTEAVKAQKRANRQQAIEAMKVAAGPAWNMVKFINPITGQKEDPNTVTVTNGSETLQIQKEDLQEAIADGFMEVK